jgi:hypothetical protein
VGPQAGTNYNNLLGGLDCYPSGSNYLFQTVQRTADRMCASNKMRLNISQIETHFQNPRLVQLLSNGQILYKNTNTAASTKIMTGNNHIPNMPIRQAYLLMGSWLVTITVEDAAID